MDRPTIGDEEVLVRVRAASVDRGTWHVMAGLRYPIRVAGFGLRRPKYLNPGRSLAGTVEATGTSVTGVKPGDEVFGIGNGSPAEYARARTGNLAPKPATLFFGQAAAVPISGLTALQAVRDHGRARAGQQALITGAPGGVGSFAVQIATAFGAEVTDRPHFGVSDSVISVSMHWSGRGSEDARTAGPSDDLGGVVAGCPAVEGGACPRLGTRRVPGCAGGRPMRT
jgi:NADPH:quinone reductase-like Zn-dependent oxidoreductase